MLGAAPPLPPEWQDHQRPAILRDESGESPIRTPDQWSRRRVGILEGMQQAMGPLPDRSTLPSPDVRVTQEVKGDGFTRQSITYAGEGAERIAADLYLPDVRAPGTRRPALIALHQTATTGRKDLESSGNPNMAYAPQLARRGYIVICPDYPSFGDSAKYDFAADAYESGTMKGIVNHMRAVDLLAQRSDVDPNRIGAIGHSLGGHNAIFLGVFDERIKVVVSCCGWTPFHDYQGGKIEGWTSDRYMPRLREAYHLNADEVPFDFPELIAAIAPRAFFSVSPTRDDDFAVDGVRKGIAAAMPIYELLGAREKLQVRYPEGGHDFTPEMREQAFAFVDQVLANEAPAPRADENFAAELPRIAPTEPADALKTFQTLPGFHMELVAAEPNVASPVAISFDENGRMYVCEMRDYSEQDKERLGRIRLLEDTDGDGTYEKATVFASDLSWPTAVICYGGGVFVGAAPDILWLKDTDGDGKADERKVVFTGFGRSNVQGLLNSFNWGLDNRIHGATSTAGGKVFRADDPKSQPLDLSGRDFSFDPRMLDLRAESGGGQHGMCFDDWGRKFVCSNSDHIQMVMIDERYLERNPLLTVPSARESIAADGPQAEVFRISPVEPWRIVRTRLRVSGAVPGVIEGGGRASGYFTSATGITIYRGDAYPPQYRGQAFIGDVGSNIVHRKLLKPKGVGFVAKRIDDGKEFVASTDTWFRPVQFANAPDGTLYVIDMYREVIEHPKSLPPMIKTHLDLTSGRERGRIWRIAPDGFVHRPANKFLGLGPEALVDRLNSRNVWQRDTAARLLYERQHKSAVPLLDNLARSKDALPEVRVHALYAQAGLKALTDKTLLGALNPNERPSVLENAIRLVEVLPKRSIFLDKPLFQLTTHPDLRVRYQAALTCGFARNAGLSPNIRTIQGAGGNRWLYVAVFAAVADRPADFLQNLLHGDMTFLQSAEGHVVASELARQIGAHNRPADVAAALEAVSTEPDLARDILKGLADGLATAGTSLRQRVATDPKAKKTLDDMLVTARLDADGLDIETRVAAIHLLPTGTYSDAKPILGRAIAADQPQEVQLAALAALDRFAEPDVGAVVTSAWSGFTPAVRTAAANVIFAHPQRTAAFLEAVESGKISAADIDRARLKSLEGSEDPKLSERAHKLLAAAPSAARQEVFDSYRPTLSLAGEASRGKAIFEKSCASCHRINDVGHEIGPSLAAMTSRGAEAILLNVIDPNREVNPQYLNYVVQTKSGRTTSGLLASETAAGITLKRSGGETETISRADIRKMRSSGLSIMPEGLEQGLDHQAMADLIAYVMSAK